MNIIFSIFVITALALVLIVSPVAIYADITPQGVTVARNGGGEMMVIMIMTAQPHCLGMRKTA